MTRPSSTSGASWRASEDAPCNIMEVNRKAYFGELGKLFREIGMKSRHKKNPSAERGGFRATEWRGVTCSS